MSVDLAGTWRVKDNRTVENLHGHWIADTGGKTHSQLIAAAPELLEALQETVKDLVAYQVNARHAAKINNRWEGCADAVQPSIDAARSAIAKALGQ